MGRGGEAGKTRVGCLFSIFLVVAGLYFGSRFFEVKYRFYRIQDEVNTQVSFAPSLTDAVIRRRLVSFSDSLGLPLGPRDWEIKRSRAPREIRISAEYQDSVIIELPGYRRVFYFTFRPQAVAGL